MYIAPNSTIVFCKNVPFDRGHTHTVRFNSPDEQYAAIYNCRKGSPSTAYELKAQSYQRYDKNTLRVQIVADNLYDCNYLMFQNTSFGDKWFYAFIDSVEYINNITSEVRYTIDVMQTYIFPYDYRLKECFIEREHIYQDALGKSLTPENIDTGDSICHYNSMKVYLNNIMYTVILYVPNAKLDEDTGELEQTEWVVYETTGVHISTTRPSIQYKPSLRNKFGGGICCLVIPHLTINEAVVSQITEAIAMIKGIGGSVAGCFEIPHEMYIDNFTDNGTLKRSFSINERNAFSYASNPEDSYSAIKNWKLLQYPFKKLVVSNGNGMNNEYRWEYFTTKDGDNAQANFEIINALLPDPTIITYPTHYRGKMRDNADYENMCVIKDFPRQCYTEDSFTTWYAQNSNALAMSTGFSVFSSMLSGGAQSLISQNPMGVIRGVSNAIDAIGQKKAAEQKAMDTPDAVCIQDNTPILNFLNDRFGFSFYDVGITGEMAKLIDSYFSLYGYSVMGVKTPNIVGDQRRSVWNYIKMGDCVMDSNELPASAEEEISNIYKNGITFWEDITQVGNYSLNNTDIQ
jgi:hypothetical protein